MPRAGVPLTPKVFNLCVLQILVSSAVTKLQILCFMQIRYGSRVSYKSNAVLQKSHPSRKFNDILHGFRISFKPDAVLLFHTNPTPFYKNLILHANPMTFCMDFVYHSNSIPFCRDRMFHANSIMFCTDSYFIQIRCRSARILCFIRFDIKNFKFSKPA